MDRIKSKQWKRYPKYKDSEVEWLGEIPESWEVKSIKRLSLIKRGASPRPIDDPIYFDDDGEYVWVRISDVTSSNKYLLLAEQKLSELGQSKSVALEPGELFLSICATVGKPIITKIKCCIHDGFVYFPHLKENREYLFYIFLGGELYKGIGKLGTQLNLNTDIIGDIKLPIPTLPEQQKIAKFLDRETAKIDILINKKQHLTKLFQEKRTALISHAVTKGLNPDVPMKDSGVEWLGMIPESWMVKKLKYIATLQSGVAKGRNLGDKLVIELPYLRVANVQDGYLDLSDIATITIGVDEIERYSLREGDVLMNEGGDFDKLGRGYIWDASINPCLHQNHVFAVRPKYQIDSLWINTITLTSYAKWYFILQSKQTTNLASISSTNLTVRRKKSRYISVGLETGRQFLYVGEPANRTAS